MIARTITRNRLSMNAPIARIILLFLMCPILGSCSVDTELEQQCKPTRHAVIPAGMVVSEPAGNFSWTFPDISYVSFPSSSEIISGETTSNLVNEQNWKNAFRYLISSPRWRIDYADSSQLAILNCPVVLDKSSKLYAKVKPLLLTIAKSEPDRGEITDSFQTGTVIEAKKGWEKLADQFVMYRIYVYLSKPGEPDAGAQLLAILAKMRGSLKEKIYIANIGEGAIGITADSSSSPARQELSKCLAQLVYDELKAALHSRTFCEHGYDFAIMPKSTIYNGIAELKVSCGGGLGLGRYAVESFANPGESGYVYLKGFEATENFPLRLGQSLGDTKQYVGWSDNKLQNFYYRVGCSIYSGDNSYAYPARVELWFHPDDHLKPERKLVEAVYKVRGWER